MAAPFGNKNAKGNPGGGRPPMAIESRAYELLAKAVIDGINPQEIDKEIKAAMDGKGKLKLLSVYLKKAASSERILTDIMRKVVPDQQKVEHSGNINISLSALFDEHAKQAGHSAVLTTPTITDQVRPEMLELVTTGEGREIREGETHNIPAVGDPASGGESDTREIEKADLSSSGAWGRENGGTSVVDSVVPILP